ncbi:MAG: TylF/MycF family methyltransferase [Acidobacteriia bacterium]|nr:TylF/MycF family methyltransferase [Terriglobia bacterium]
MRHPLPELLYRARNPGFVADSAIRATTYLWDLVSPFEFSVLFREVQPYTMCSSARLRGLYRAVRYVAENRVPGDLVECGSAKGGSAALMALTSRRLGENRRIWLFDTFEGLPAPTSDDPDYKIASLFTGDCVGTLDEVQKLFGRLHLAEDARFVKGLFQETLHRTQIPTIAVLHIDGDWYESVKVCLDELYDKVTPGGVIQFDDYGYWQGARRAVDEFFERRGITPTLQRLDFSGRSLIKSADSAVQQPGVNLSSTG